MTVKPINPLNYDEWRKLYHPQDLVTLDGCDDLLSDYKYVFMKYIYNGILVLTDTKILRSFVFLEVGEKFLIRHGRFCHIIVFPELFRKGYFLIQNKFQKFQVTFLFLLLILFLRFETKIINCVFGEINY